MLINSKCCFNLLLWVSNADQLKVTRLHKYGLFFEDHFLNDSFKNSILIFEDNLIIVCFYNLSTRKDSNFWRFEKDLMCFREKQLTWLIDPSLLGASNNVNIPLINTKIEDLCDSRIKCFQNDIFHPDTFDRLTLSNDMRGEKQSIVPI